MPRIDKIEELIIEEIDRRLKLFENDLKENINLRLNIIEKCDEDRLGSLLDDAIKCKIDLFMFNAESSLQQTIQDEIKSEKIALLNDCAIIKQTADELSSNGNMDHSQSKSKVTLNDRINAIELGFSELRRKACYDKPIIATKKVSAYHRIKNVLRKSSIYFKFVFISKC